MPLPDGLSFVDGALIACGFGTAYEGIRRIGVNGDDDLLVVGLGPVGLAAAMTGRGVARGGSSAWRSRPSAAHGRTDWTSSTRRSARKRRPTPWRRSPAGGASTAIDCSGTRPGRSTAIGHIAEWGRISLVGEGGTLETEVSDALLHKQVTLYASWVTSVPVMAELARNLVRWGVRPERIVSDRFDLAGRTRRSGSPRALPGARSCSNPVWTAER
ncbi:hypothetical protein NKH18_01620 [Streptomyces sp. M10(2022)]